MAGKGKQRLRLFSTLTLHNTPETVEQKITSTLFPSASTQPRTYLRIIALDSEDSDLDTPFTMAELSTAIRQSKAKSAPGHDGVMWQHIRNLDKPQFEQLLAIWNHSGNTGEIRDAVKLSLVDLIPKPGKDPSVISKL